jgi:hypothetical protein
VLAAVQQNGYALEYASDELKKEREIVLTAMRSDRDALQFASKELQNDCKIVQIVQSKAVEEGQWGCFKGYAFEDILD